jgi:large subunit ribosomal protein L32
MAVPKRRTSKSRSRTRQAHDALPKPSFAKCPRCSQAVKPHTVCGNCGYYRGTMIVDMDATTESAAPKKGE